MATTLFSVGKLGCNPSLSSSLKPVSQRRGCKAVICSGEDERRLKPSCCCQSHTVITIIIIIITKDWQNSGVNDNQRISRHKAQLCASAPVKAASPPCILAGRPFRWILMTSNTFSLFLERTAGVVTVLVLQGEAPSGCRAPCEGHHALFWVSAAEGHGPA